MAKRQSRKMISYMVCCDCEPCQDDTGDLMKIWKTERTLSAAQQWLRKETEGHSSLFVAQETIEALTLPSQRRRKAA